MTGFEKLADERHISLKTFKRDGSGVPTALWFVLHDGALYARSMLRVGKVKRLRNFSNVEIAVCEADGTVTGPWQPGSARLLEDSDPLGEVADRLLDEKYGEARRALSRGRSANAEPRVWIEMRPAS